MRDALICEPLRTPVGRFGGIFRDVPVTSLATTVIKAILERTGLPHDQVDDVLLGQGYANGEAPALGRVAGDPQAYGYLPSSVRRFPSPEALAAIMSACGLHDLRYILTAGGIIALLLGTAA